MRGKAHNVPALRAGLRRSSSAAGVLAALVLATGTAGQRPARASGPHVADLPEAALAALQAALAHPEARMVVTAWRPPTTSACRVERAEAAGRVDRSGRVAVRIEGRNPAGRACLAWAAAEVRIEVPALVLTRDVAEGEPLTGAAAREHREAPPGRRLLPQVPPDAVAARALRAGEVIEEPDVRAAGPRPGASIPVVAVLGAVRVEQRGTVVSCHGSHTCAVLPSGRRVSGALENGRLLVDLSR